MFVTIAETSPKHWSGDESGAAKSLKASFFQTFYLALASQNLFFMKGAALDPSESMLVPPLNS